MPILYIYISMPIVFIYMYTYLCLFYIFIYLCLLYSFICRDGHCGTGAAHCDTATLPQSQFGVAVEGREEGLKSAAVEVPRSLFLYCGPRLYLK